MSVSRINALRAFAVGLGEIDSGAVGLGDFSPGIDAARAQGIRVTRDTYALGDAGTLGQSIPMVLQKVREGRLDPAVRGWTGDVLHAAGDPQGIRAKAQAILDAFRSATIYAPDPAGAEFIASAAATLCLRPGLCIRARDCDDGVVCVGSCLSSINIPVWVVFQDFGAGKQQHVLLGSQDEMGNKFYIDPSTKWPVGSSAQAQREEWFDPLDGLPAPEIVGVGWSPLSGGYFSGVGGVTSETPGNDNAAERHLVKRADGLWWEYAGGSWHREVRGVESEVGVGSVGSWEPADWSDMKPIVHEVGLEGVKQTIGPRGMRAVGLDPNVSLAATPAPSPAQTTEYIETDFSAIKKGARYYFAIKSDLSAGDLQAILIDDWNPVEQFESDLPGYFRVRAIAAHDMPPGPASGDIPGASGLSKGFIQYLKILVEVATGTVAPLVPAAGTSSNPVPDGPDPSTPPADVNGVDGYTVVKTAAVGAAVVGAAWGLWRMSKLRRARTRRYA